MEGVRLIVRLERLPIAGRVIGADGEPLPDVVVFAVPGEPVVSPQQHQHMDRLSTVTDISGAFSITVPRSGTYALLAREARGAEARVPAVTAGRRDVVIHMNLRGTGNQQLPQ
jgi:hypothetical protein